MKTPINATDLARGLSDVLNRVRYRGESFVIERSGEPTALLAPIETRAAFTMREFVRRLADLPAPDSGFADELEEIQASLSQNIREFARMPGLEGRGPAV